MTSVKEILSRDSTCSLFTVGVYSLNLSRDDGGPRVNLSLTNH